MSISIVVPIYQASASNGDRVLCQYKFPVPDHNWKGSAEATILLCFLLWLSERQQRRYRGIFEGDWPHGWYSISRSITVSVIVGSAPWAGDGAAGFLVIDEKSDKAHENVICTGTEMIRCGPQWSGQPASTGPDSVMFCLFKGGQGPEREGMRGWAC